MLLYKNRHVYMARTGTNALLGERKCVRVEKEGSPEGRLYGREAKIYGQYEKVNDRSPLQNTDNTYGRYDRPYVMNTSQSTTNTDLYHSYYCKTSV